MWRGNGLGIDEIQPDTALAYSTRLLAILTSRKSFVTLEMSLSAGQAAGPDPLGLCYFRGRSRFRGLRRAGNRPFWRSFPPLVVRARLL